ncbi:MAG TPA: class II fructose-bisphosphate aldolase [Trueperaceae bacterium]
MIATLRDVLAEADREGSAVGAFTVVTREDIQGTLAAAEELGRSVILQASPKQLEAAGLDELAQEMVRAAERSTVPVVVQLDHGDSFEIACRCLRRGFSSVLIDGSLLPFDENIELTSRVVAVAHALGSSVEGELGHIGGTEDDVTTESSDLTTVDEAVNFVEATGIDALAVAIGNAHGTYRTTPRLELGRAAEIYQAVPVPLVLHGGSSLAEETIREAIKAGFRKINIGTELKTAHTDALRQFLAANPEQFDPRAYLPIVRGAVRRLAARKMMLFSSPGVAAS